MEYKFGNLLLNLNNYNYILVTTNSFIKKDGTLVMGRGFAKQIKEQFDGIDRIFGNLISNSCGHLSEYGLLFHGKIGIFQVKYNYMDKADLNLVRNSTNKLYEIASKHSNFLFALNCPAIGNGKLDLSSIDPIINILPNNVHVWRNE